MSLNFKFEFPFPPSPPRSSLLDAHLAQALDEVQLLQRRRRVREELVDDGGGQHVLAALGGSRQRESTRWKHCEVNGDLLPQLNEGSLPSHNK